MAAAADSAHPVAPPPRLGRPGIPVATSVLDAPRDGSLPTADDATPVDGLVRFARRYRVGAPDAEDVPLSAEALQDGGDHQLLWVDVQADPADGDERLVALERLLGLEGVLAQLPDDTEPMVRFHDGALTVRLTALDRRDGRAEPVPLSIVAAPNLVLSVHPAPIARLDDPVRVVATDPRFGRLDAGTFLGLLMDGVLDGYFREIEAIERIIDELDLRALRARDPEELLEELVGVRHRIAVLRRLVAPHREVFVALVRPVAATDESWPIGWPWPGLPDRLERVLDAIENAREQMIGTFDVVTTRTTEHTNDVMRILTVVSSLLLPSVVIAGVMGMNFQVGWFDDPNNFLVVLVVMAALAIATLVVARVRRWI